MDKGLKRFFPNDRPYSTIEAMFSLTLDNDLGQKHSILYYSKLWLWDRKKVRKLVNLQGQPRDTYRVSRGTPTGSAEGHPIRLINSGVGSCGDTYRVSRGTPTGSAEGQSGDSRGTPHSLNKQRCRTPTGSAEGQSGDSRGTLSSNLESNPKTKSKSKSKSISKTRNTLSTKLESSKLLISHLEQFAIVGKPKPVKKLSWEPVDEDIADLLVKHIKRNLPNFKVPPLASWRNECRLMRDRDKRKPEDIRKVIEFCQQDVFWRGNVLSVKKLRMQFDRLSLRMLAVTPPSAKKSRSELLRERIHASEEGGGDGDVHDASDLGVIDLK